MNVREDGLSRLEWLFLLVICLSAGVLRFWRISDRTIWFDEAFSWTLATEFTPAEIVERTGRDVHPPLYYVLLSAWTACWGDSLFALRSLSALLGTAAVAVAWFAGREFGGCRPSSSRLTDGNQASAGGFFLSVLVATSAFQIRWSGEVRMYALLSLLFLLAVYFAFRAVRVSNCQRRWWVLFSLSCAAMMYTHNYGLFSVVGLWGFVAAGVVCGRPQSTPDEWKRRVSYCVAAIAGAGLLYLPWFPVLLFQKAQVADDYWMGNFTWRSVAYAFDHLFIPENEHSGSQLLRGTAALLLVVTGASLLQWRGQIVDRLCLWLTLVPIVLVVVISNVGTTIIGNRLFTLVHLAALMTVTRVFVRWVDPISALLLGALLAVDGLYIHHRYQVQLDVVNCPGVRAVMDVVKKSEKPEIPVIVLQPAMYFSARFYAANRHLVLLYTFPENIRHYTGAPVLRSDEVHVISELDARKETELWVVSSTGYTAGYEQPFLSAAWTCLHTDTFPATYSFEGNVRVSKWRRATASFQPVPLQHQTDGAGSEQEIE